MNYETKALEILEKKLNVNGPFTLENISGGLSGSQIIKVIALGHAFVIRFWNMKWAEYFPQDLACQLIASGAGYGPRVFYSDEKAGVSV